MGRNRDVEERWGERTIDIDILFYDDLILQNEILEIPLVSIGKMFGGRDHHTIINARDKITDQLKTSHKIQGYISEIKKLLSQNN